MQISPTDSSRSCPVYNDDKNGLIAKNRAFLVPFHYSKLL